jgi:hypothetical protein
MQALIDLVEVERIGIEGKPDPTDHVIVLFVIRIRDRFEKLLVPGAAADIFGRRGSCAGATRRIHGCGVNSPGVLEKQYVPPIVAKVVEITDSIANRESRSRRRTFRSSSNWGSSLS